MVSNTLHSIFRKLATRVETDNPVLAGAATTGAVFDKINAQATAAESAQVASAAAAQNATQATATAAAKANGGKKAAKAGKQN
jgi:hypothetical protein